MDILETVTKVFKSFLDDESKPPLHVGEVMAIWTYLVAMREAVVVEQAAINMSTTPELLQAVEEGMNMCASQAERMETFLIAEGVPLPRVSSSKPHTKPDDVPLGAKFTDDEIANTMSIKVATAITACAQGQATSLRNDVGMMWVQFQMEQISYATNLKSLMRKSGWLKVPPYYNAPGLPT